MSKEHVASIDGWRGVLAACVLGFHFSSVIFQGNWMPWGYLGVDFFFLLSGYVSSRTYETGIANRTIGFRQFIVRRATRLYPLFLVSIVLFLTADRYVCAPQSLEGPAIGMGEGAVLVYHSALLLAMLNCLSDMVPPNSVVWAVSVEWVVSLAYFFVIRLFRHIPLLWLSSIVVAALVALIIESPRTVQSLHPVPQVARGVVGFGLGLLIYRIHRTWTPDPSVARYAWEVVQISLTFTLLVGLSVSLPVLHSSTSELPDYRLESSCEYVLILTAFPSLLFLSLLRNGILNSLLSIPPLTMLGRLSYSIYLFQFPLALWMKCTPAYDAIGPALFGPAYVATLLVVSVGMHYLIERPAQVLGRRLADRKWR